MKRDINIFILILLGIFWCGLSNATAAPLHLNVSPGTVEIGTFYNGTTIQVSGEMPVTAKAVILLTGEGETLHLKRKGKVGGLLWMNTGDITIHNAPRVYKLFTGKGLTDLDNSPAREVGFTALENRIEVSPVSTDNDFLKKEFVRLKNKDKLYSTTPNSISYSPEQEGIKSFQATVDIPSAMKQGKYSVEVAVVQDGNIVATARQPLKIKQVSFPQEITTLAFDHELLYGIMAVCIAIMAGLAMGLLFKDKGGAH